MSTLSLINDALVGLTDAQAGQLLRALCLLESKGETTEFTDPLLKAIFAIVKSYNKGSYEDLAKSSLEEKLYIVPIDSVDVIESTSSDTLGEVKPTEKEQVEEVLPSPAPLLFPEEDSIITNKPENKSLKENLKKKPSLNLDFVEDERFLEPLKEWLDYKREKGQTYKPRGLKMCYNEMLKLSGGDPKVALEDVVRFSMSNNYAGLYLRKGATPTSPRANSTETTINVNDRYDVDQYDF